jgi:hypothetical protein
MYLSLINNGSIIRNTLIWKLKIPVKIKIFYVVYAKGGDLNKWQLGKKKLEREQAMLFLYVNESIQHLF